MRQLDMFSKELREVIINKVKERISWEVKRYGYLPHARLYRRELQHRYDLFRRYDLI